MRLRSFSNAKFAVIEIRQAGIDEYSHAAQMRHQMSVEHEGDFDTRSTDWRKRYCAYFSERQRQGKAQLFLAYQGDRAAGMAIVSELENYRSALFGTRLAYVNSVFVYPQYRRGGIGRRLMEAVLTWAQEKGYAQVRLRSSAQGRPLYESLNFKPTSEMQLDL